MVEKPQPTTAGAPRRAGGGSWEAASRLQHLGTVCFYPSTTYDLPLFTYLPGRAGRGLRKGE